MPECRAARRNPRNFGAVQGRGGDPVGDGGDGRVGQHGGGHAEQGRAATGGGAGRPPQLCRGTWGPGRMATLLEAACRAGAAACTIARCSAVRSSGAFWGLICLGPLPGPSTHYLFPEAALLRPTPHHLQAQLRGLISDYQGGDEGVLAQAFEAFDMLSRCAGPRCAALGVGESSGARGGGGGSHARPS